MHISHKKRDHPILGSSHTIEVFPSKNISLQTTIIGETQELLGDRFSMDESSIFIGFKLNKGMVTLHL